jgi:hypothetical protein
LAEKEKVGPGQKVIYSAYSTADGEGGWQLCIILEGFENEMELRLFLYEMMRPFIQDLQPAENQTTH